MGILDIFKKRDPRNNHDFSLDERQLAAERTNTKFQLTKRKAELEIQQLERVRQDLEELRGDDYEEQQGSNPEDTILATLLTKVLAGSSTQAVHAAPIITTPTAPTYTDDQILDLWNSQDKKTQKMILAMPNNQIARIIKERLPSITDQEITHAIGLIRSV
jgi:hypothetical protein